MDKFWEKFVDQYSKDTSYWYVNKRLAITRSNIGLIQKQLQILDQFDGKTWDQGTQTRYYDKLIEKKLIKRRVGVQKQVDANASVRMLKVIFDTLGLAWVNNGKITQITDVGRDIINSPQKKASEIIEFQIRRYQFWNPSIKAIAYREIKLFPYYFLLSLFVEGKLNYIDKDEYILFVAKAKNHSDKSAILDQILRWRNLKRKDKEKIKQELLKRPRIVNAHQQVLSEEIDIREQRQSVYKTINQNAPYSLTFYSFPHEFNLNLHKICFRKEYFLECQKILDFFNKNFAYAEFKTEKDWFAFYGDSKKTSTVDNVIAYYSDISDVEKVIEMYKYAKVTGKESEIVKTTKEKEFIRGVILEKMLEDYLEYNDNLQKLEMGLRLIENGRQFDTIVGSIDLLAKDRNGNFVAIELKKGRTSDRVFSQISRYMGWIKRYLAKEKEVRGIIIGKTFEPNIWFALENSKYEVNLFTFEYNVSFERAGH